MRGKRAEHTPGCLPVPFSMRVCWRSLHHQQQLKTGTPCSCSYPCQNQRWMKEGGQLGVLGLQTPVEPQQRLCHGQAGPRLRRPPSLVQCSPIAILQLLILTEWRAPIFVLYYAWQWCSWSCIPGKLDSYSIKRCFVRSPSLVVRWCLSKRKGMHKFIGWKIWKGPWKPSTEHNLYNL